MGSKVWLVLGPTCCVGVQSPGGPWFSRRGNRRPWSGCTRLCPWSGRDTKNVGTRLDLHVLEVLQIRQFQSRDDSFITL